MTPDADENHAWRARVIDAGVLVDLFDDADDDYGFAMLGQSILRATSQRTLSDDDLYPLLVRFWTGRVPSVDWPPHAPASVRRCALSLASAGTCELEPLICAPSGAAMKASLDAIVADLSLTPGGLLVALADHWPDLAGLDVPLDGERTLLAFARHVLLEPLVGACALIWSTLDAPSTPTSPVVSSIKWADWSLVWDSAWHDVISAELARLGQPAVRLPDDFDEAADLLAHARAASLDAQGDTAIVGASIVRTSGWPGETRIVDPLANRAVRLALERVNDIDPKTDNDDIVDDIQKGLVPQPEQVDAWIRDPSFGTLSDHAGCSRTGAELLQQAVDWLTWSLAHDAVQVVQAMRPAPSSRRASAGRDR